MSRSPERERTPMVGVEQGTSEDLARRFRHHVHALQLLMQRARFDRLSIDEDGVGIWVEDAAQGAQCASLDDVEAFVGLALRP